LHTLLVADDDADFRTYLRIALEREGFRVVEAVDGRDALVKVATTRPDMLLMDFDMGVPDGGEVVAAVRRSPESCELPIIFLTAGFPRWVSGVQAVLFKPVDPVDLVSAIRGVLDRAPSPG
jgi:CheY-like chemotaxis protein